MEAGNLVSSLRIELGLDLVAGADGLDRRVTEASIQRPGLALAGFAEMLEPGRVQVLGRTEIDYLWSLGPAERLAAADNLFGASPPLAIVTRGAEIPEQLARSADAHRVPLAITGLRSSLLVEALHIFLANRLARVRSIHGVLVDVFGVGVLIIGKSGIGKSECALELVMRGHRLVADDVVDVSKRPPSTIVGSGNALIRHHMEIRGLGIIDIRDLFGVAAIRENKRIDLVIDMEEWSEAKSYDRLGAQTATREILGVAIPEILIPVRPGRSLTTIVEVAARNQLLKAMGHNSAADFQKEIDERIRRTGREPEESLARDLDSGDVE